MVVGNKKVAMIFILHFNKITQSAKVITEVQITGWPDSTYNCIHKKKRFRN